ncbi:putative poly(ADP-ribose) polymerase catalytic domain [Lyophyllum shimeji]|uniref:Poly(ADP-ribose) polymerase catalytic domain n=1 Tax=Lyophyllum shimeji TaxID=47721 RepID=A0A9P3UQY6_LYOSH|nr:putative poly(ADP-ribose) polymerase catalytic domain [Lyophyllum shimeji]
MSSTSTLCENCNHQPKHLDSATGLTYPYCSRNCAYQAQQQHTGPVVTSTSPDNCDNCKARPKHRDPASGAFFRVAGVVQELRPGSGLVFSLGSSEEALTGWQMKADHPSLAVLGGLTRAASDSSPAVKASIDVTEEGGSLVEAVLMRRRLLVRGLMPTSWSEESEGRKGSGSSSKPVHYWDLGSKSFENIIQQHRRACSENWVCTRLLLDNLAVERMSARPPTPAGEAGSSESNEVTENIENILQFQLLADMNPTVISPTSWTCQAPGCQRTPFENYDGSFSYYCGSTHKALAQTICLMCRRAPKQPKSHFCSERCTEDVYSKGPMILPITKGHVTYKSVEDQFKTSWRHLGKPCPTIRFIYKIIIQKASLDSYNAYRDSVEKRGHFEAAGLSSGNEQRRWHGTKRRCNIGDTGCTTLCASTDCPMCCIVRTSFDLNKFGSKTGWGRFGRGIYTSSTSSKSHDYAGTDSASKLKAILLNKVVIGKGYKIFNDDPSLVAPPPGFDSVLAEKGGSLNHDELVVYRSDAIRPSYLVLYEQ